MTADGPRGRDPEGDGHDEARPAGGGGRPNEDAQAAHPSDEAGAGDRRPDDREPIAEPPSPPAEKGPAEGTAGQPLGPAGLPSSLRSTLEHIEASLAQRDAAVDAARRAADDARRQLEPIERAMNEARRQMEPLRRAIEEQERWRRDIERSFALRPQADIVTRLQGESAAWQVFELKRYAFEEELRLQQTAREQVEAFGREYRQVAESLRGWNDLAAIRLPPSVSLWDTLFRDVDFRGATEAFTRTIRDELADAWRLANVDPWEGLKRATTWHVETPLATAAWLDTAVRNLAPQFALADAPGIEAAFVAEFTAALGRVPARPVAVAEPGAREDAATRFLVEVWDHLLARYPNLPEQTRRRLWALLFWLLATVSSAVIAEAIGSAGDQQLLDAMQASRQVEERIEHHLSVLAASAPPARYLTLREKRAYEDHDTKAKLAATIPADVILEVRDREERWLYVEWEGPDGVRGEGWVYKQHLRPLPNDLMPHGPGWHAADPQ